MGLGAHFTNNNTLKHSILLLQVLKIKLLFTKKESILKSILK